MDTIVRSAVARVPTIVVNQGQLTHQPVQAWPIWLAKSLKYQALPVLRRDTQQVNAAAFPLFTWMSAVEASSS